MSGSTSDYVLGVWDGHDSGACLLFGDRIIAASNEERYTRRKLEIRFPFHSIEFCLRQAGIKPSDVRHIACSTMDPAKALSRLMPSTKERYYNIRRRLSRPSPLNGLGRDFKYWITAKNPAHWSVSLSKWELMKCFEKAGFELGTRTKSKQKLHLVDHHLSHAYSAAMCSGFNRQLVITLDGLGDGRSGSVSIYNDGEFERISDIGARDSLGIMYEHATNILGMRELEDEGKVMALSDFSAGVPDSKNPCIGFFSSSGLNIKSKASSMRMRTLLLELSRKMSKEDFSYCVQRALEKHSSYLFKSAIDETGIKDVAWAGGVASNIKLNKMLREESGLRDWFVFPHMGDGGLAMGAALAVANLENGTKQVKLAHAYLGDSFSDEKIRLELKRENKSDGTLKIDQIDNPSKVGSEIVSGGDYLLWFQGRMEYGPRALGNRSIIAPANSLAVKDRLNELVKGRDYYQPFCPSIIDKDSKKIIGHDGKRDRFMTMAYDCMPDVRDMLSAVVHVDKTLRPQVVGDENPLFRSLLSGVRKKTGLGAVLNTSFNLHGYPIVRTPQDAIYMMRKTKSRYLIIGDIMVEGDFNANQ